LLIGFAGGNQPDNLIIFPVAVTHYKQVFFFAHTEQHKPFFIFRMFFIVPDFFVCVGQDFATNDFGFFE